MEGSPVWTLGDLVLDPERYSNTAYGSGEGVHWFLEEEQGFWGAPGNNAESIQRFNNHGAIRGPGWKAERVVSLKGYAFAKSYEELRRAAHQLTGMFADPYNGVALTCRSEIGELTCEVFLDGDIITQPHHSATPALTWNLQVVAPDPRKYSTQWKTQSTSLPSDTPNDGLNFEAGASPNIGLDFGVPGDNQGLLFGTSTLSTGFLVLQNLGNAPTTPVYRLYGPLTTPTLSVTVNGDTHMMRYNGSLNVGEYVEIDPFSPYVLLDGTSSRRHLLNPADFRGFEIPPASFNGSPGVLSIGLSHQGSSSSGGYVEASFRSAWF